MKNYLSFGGGVNSVALYLLMEQLGIDFEAVFVDHGADYPETYEYLEYFKSTGREVTVLRPEHFSKKARKVYIDLYEYCWDFEMVPSMTTRWCTGMFKIVPVHKYIEKPCFMHLGIDAGEQRRARLSSTNGVENRYLLIEHNIDRDGCKQLIQEALEIPPKSGCWFCPYQKVSQWKQLRKNHPDLFCKAQKLEKRNMEYQERKGKGPFSLRGDGRTLDKLINDNQANLWPEMDYPPCQCGL